MLPADQRLDADRPASAHVHLGLVVQHELPLLESGADLLQAVALALGSRVVRQVEKVVAVLACLLGQVHGLVRVAHQQVGADAVLRVDRHADARGHAEALAAQDHGLRRSQQQPL